MIVDIDSRVDREFSPLRSFFSRALRRRPLPAKPACQVAAPKVLTAGRRR